MLKNHCLLWTSPDMFPYSNIPRLILFEGIRKSQDTFTKHLMQSFCKYYGFSEALNFDA